MSEADWKLASQESRYLYQDLLLIVDGTIQFDFVEKFAPPSSKQSVERGRCRLDGARFRRE